MLLLITYDVCVTDPQGSKRLRQIAKACMNNGLRVQKSVFECEVDPVQWEFFKAKLLKIYNPNKDSLRFYFLGSNWERKIEHHGANKIGTVRDPMIF